VLGRSGVQDSGAALTQFPLVGDAFSAQSTEVSLADRPPMNTLRPARAAA
jgi:glucosyl-3-phosphoglycerate synthase